MFMPIAIVGATMGAATDTVSANWWDNRIGFHFVEEAVDGGVRLGDGFSFGFIQGEIDLPEAGRWLVTVPVRTAHQPAEAFQSVQIRINGEEIAYVEDGSGMVDVQTMVRGGSFFYNFEFLMPLEATSDLVVLAGGAERLCDGDINGDRHVDVLDLVDFQRAYVSGDEAADCNLDGVVDIVDYICFQPAYLRGCE